MIKQLVNVITTLIVVYNTFNAFKVKKLNKRLRKNYSYYFTVISIFLCLDTLFSAILNFIPFYQLIKLVAVIWLSVPVCSGSLFVYKFYLNGILATYEVQIDRMLECAGSKITRIVNEYYNLAHAKYKEHKDKRFGNKAVSSMVEEIESKVEISELSHGMNSYDKYEEDYSDTELTNYESMNGASLNKLDTEDKENSVTVADAKIQVTDEDDN